MGFLLKPMALDPLFWDIVGLPENRKMPLSFRANGAWVLRPPQRESKVGLDVSEVTRLAELVAQWAAEKLEQSRTVRSVEQMIANLMESSATAGHQRALAICLNIMNRDLDNALALCRESAGSDLLDGGGFTTINRDGTVSTFVKQAEAWIIAKRRSGLRLV